MFLGISLPCDNDRFVGSSWCKDSERGARIFVPLSSGISPGNGHLSVITLILRFPRIGCGVSAVIIN